MYSLLFGWLIDLNECIPHIHKIFVTDRCIIPRKPHLKSVIILMLLRPAFNVFNLHSWLELRGLWERSFVKIIRFSSRQAVSSQEFHGLKFRLVQPFLVIKMVMFLKILEIRDGKWEIKRFLPKTKNYFCGIAQGSQRQLFRRCAMHFGRGAMRTCHSCSDNHCIMWTHM